MPQYSIEDYIRRQAKEQGVPPELALAVAEQESGPTFNPAALGPEIEDPTDRTKKIRAIGTFQFLPSTAQTVGIDPHDPAQNIQGGVKYLRQLLDRHEGDLQKVLAEYGGVKTNTTYVPGVLQRIPKFRGGHRVTGQAPEVGVPPPPVIPPYQRPAPGAAPLPEPGPTSRLEEAAQIGGQVLSAFDPRERQGRRNLAAAAGGATAAALTGGIGVLPALTGMAGAGLFAGAQEAAEQLGEGLRTGKPEEAYKPGETVKVAGRAALEEGVGAGVVGLARGVTTRLMAIPVAKKAAAGINRQAQEVVGRLKSGLEDVTAGLRTTSRRTAGEAAAATMAGPAKRTYQDLGEAVEAAAQSGPPVPVKDLRERLQTLAAEIAPPDAPPALTMRGEALPPEVVARIRAAQPQLSLPIGDHPLPGLLGDLQAALADRETIPFAEAHRIKVLLDAAVNWESPAKSMVSRVTKATRQSLRDSMRGVGYQPYEGATAAYEAATPLFRKGYGQRLSRIAATEPASLIPLIKPDNPQQAVMLRKLLTDLPAEQGAAGTRQGQQAWDAVRHAWTFDRLIKGHPEKLPERLAKLDPDFVQEFFRHDPAGQQVYENLATIGQAFTQQRDVVNQLVEEFRKSTLQLETKGNAIERMGADLSRVAFLGPQSFWGASSFMRLILEKPSGKELLRWATFNNNGAAPLLAQVLNNPYPGTAAADLLRLFNRDHGLEEGPGVPPPAPQPAEISLSISNRGQVGTPPPR